MKIRIYNDLYDIASRIKEIDSSYFIVYNTRTKKYEVHSHNQRGNTMCLVVPYECLDARTIEYTRYTMVQNYAKLIKQLDKQNQELIRQENQAIIEKSLDYADRQLTNDS